MDDGPTSQEEFWQRRAMAWDRRAESLEAFAARFGDPAIDRLDVRPGERILDIGCGPGTTAIRLASQVGDAGSVLGVDISAVMIDVARRRSAAAGATNLEFLVADVEKPLPVGGFDGAYSRFGVMFFIRPVVAFANIASALSPGGRFSCTVWGGLSDNPWMYIPVKAASRALDIVPEAPGSGSPGPFSLGGSGCLASVFEAAGFVDVSVEAVTGHRVLARGSFEREVAAMLDVGPLTEAFEAADQRSRDSAIEATREALSRYESGDGWAIPALALVGSAHTRGHG